MDAIKNPNGRKCQCGATKGLTRHHITPKRLGGSDDPSNLIILCKYCHTRIHQKYK